MYKKTLLALTLSTMSVAAFAGNSSFEGPYVGATISMLNTDADFKVDEGTVKVDSDGNNAGYGLSLGYGALNGSFYGAVEAAFRVNYGTSEDSTGLLKTDVKDGWELSFLPGYLVDETTLIYARIGFGSVNAELSLPSIGMSETDDLDSMVWGLGFQKAFTDQVSAKLEYNRTSFNKKYTGLEIDGDSSGLSLGVQYRF